MGECDVSAWEYLQFLLAVVRCSLPMCGFVNPFFAIDNILRLLLMYT
jgi:hypothetical protein